ncbi:MAG: hypothetical protein KQ78_01451 [Candidatus Izimaplasma bacterium HR2]|nr:MAG: hypothetical protein KQ78_01451 [Candidatus Izimaplasma bacterium HR2]
MKKKILIFIFTLSFVFALAGCQAEDSYIKGDYNDYENTNTDPVAPPAEVVDPNLSGGDVILDADIPALLNRKIIYTAALTMESPTPETIYNNVIDNLDLYDAYVESANITSTRYTIKIRVLSVNFTDFVEEIKTSGDLLSYTKSSEDVTNAYSTFEARKLALETQHARILELIAVAVDLDDILTLEDARFEIETELNEIGDTLANFDSLVDYSTIDLQINKTVETEVILPRTENPAIFIIEVNKNSAEIEVFNTGNFPATIYVDLLQNGEFVRQYEQDAWGDSKAIFKIGELDSNKEYTFKVTSISSDHRVSYEISKDIETDKTFINDVTNVFVTSFTVLVAIFEFLGLSIVAISPFAVTGVILFFPARITYKKVQPIMEEKRKKRLAYYKERRKNDTEEK